MTKVLNGKTIFFLIVLIGGILRFYNVNFDNYWYDEIISFWVSSPELTFSESFEIHNRIEINTYTYHLLLKVFHNLFGYELYYGRYISAFFGTLSILIIPLFFKNYKIKDLNYIICLLSLNIFLISYSQETRVYSILFFFSLITFFSFKNIIEINNSSIFNYIIYVGSSIIAILLHPFAIIILISSIFFLVLKFQFERKVYSKLNKSLVLIIFLTSLFYYFYLSSLVLTHNKHYWIDHPDIGFYSNFFFSNFFGSRLMGLIFLISLIFVIFKDLRYLKINYKTFLILTIFLSYLLPIVFGYLFKPILIPRYIIFILIPVMTLIFICCFEIKNYKFRYILINFLIISTIANHFTEQTFNQFLNDRVPHKPEYEKAIQFIDQSGYSNFYIKVTNMKDNSETINSIKNYIQHLSKKINANIKYNNLIENRKINNLVWIICVQDINPRECNPPNILSNFKIELEKDFNNINLKLIKFI